MSPQKHNSDTPIGRQLPVAGMLRRSGAPPGGPPLAPPSNSAPQQQPGKPAALTPQASASPSRSEPQAPPDRGGSASRRQPQPGAPKQGNRRLPRPLSFALKVALLGVIWFVASRLGTGVPATPQTNTSPQGTASLQAPASPTSSVTVTNTATSGQPAPSSPNQATAQFLAAYFTWSKTDADQIYMQRWSQLVDPDLVVTLDETSPRQSLDAGNDGAAQSGLPLITTDAILVQQHSAQVAVTWTIQVLPKGGESAPWQQRAIQASVWLTQTNTTWLISKVVWSASAS